MFFHFSPNSQISSRQRPWNGYLVFHFQSFFIIFTPFDKDLIDSRQRFDQDLSKISHYIGRIFGISFSYLGDFLHMLWVFWAYLIASPSASSFLHFSFGIHVVKLLKISTLLKVTFCQQLSSLFCHLVLSKAL